MDSTVTFTTPPIENIGYTFTPDAQKMTREESPAYLFDGIVNPSIRVLLASVLGAIDASIPNKDQNRAVKHILRTNFDIAYFDMLRGFFPNNNYAYGPGYAVMPESDKAKAIVEGGAFLQK